MGRALVELVVFTGMRASELRGLAWRNVDMKKGNVRVEQRADAKGVLDHPKSKAGVRTIPLARSVVTTLCEWKLACPHHSEDLVLPSENSRVLSHGVMAKNHLKPIIVAAGVTKPGKDEEEEAISKYTAHMFRHAAASLWIDQGMNPKRVQVLVGHSSIQVTFDVYGHLFEQKDGGVADADAIGRALFSEAD